MSATLPGRISTTIDHTERWLAAALVFWAVGVQISEALAAAGAVGTAVVLLVAFARGERWKVLGLERRTLAPLLAFVVWGAFTTIVRGRPGSSGAVARHFDWLLVPVAAAAFSRLGERARGRVAIAALIGLVVSAIAAALQHFGWWPSMERFAAWGIRIANMERVYEEAPGDSGRFMAGGLLRHRLKFAHVTALLALWGVAVGLQLRGRVRAIAFGAAALAVASVLLFTYARAALVATLLALVVVVARHRLRRGIWIAAVSALAVAGLVVGLLQPGLRERLSRSSEDEGSGYRRELLRAGTAAVRAHPWLGTGIGNFRVGSWAPADAPAAVREHRGKSHNLFLSTAAETGLLGLLLFTVMLAALWRTSLYAAPWGAVGEATLVLLVALGMLHDPLFHAEVSMAFALSLGASWSRRT